MSPSRPPLPPLHQTHQPQGVGGAELQAKTLMRRGASSWSATGLQLPAVGRRGKSGFSPWKRRQRTLIPWIHNYRWSHPPFACNNPFILFFCVRHYSDAQLCAFIIKWCYTHFPSSSVMKSLKPIKLNCRVTAAECEPFTSIRPCQ